MSNADIRGQFIWHELMTTDPEAAGAFYSKVVPWKTQPSAMPDYSLWIAGKTGAGGLMALTEEEQASGRAPHWLVYIGTANVDATVQEAQRLGARVLKPAADIPEVGRFAVLADPQGAQFAVYTPSGGPSAGSSVGGPGGFSWHELATTDPRAALAFYVELFGWQKGPAMDMGEAGAYQLIEHGGAQVGGLYRARGPIAPHWLSYVRVADAERAAADARSAGGRVVNGPMEVPGGSWIAMLEDPQGGAFAVHEPAEEAVAVKPAPAKKAVRPPKPRPVEVPARSSEAPARAAAAEQPKPAMTSEPVGLPPPAAASTGKPSKRTPPPSARRVPAKKTASRKPATRKVAAKKVAAKKAVRGKAAAKKRPAGRMAAGAARSRAAAKGRGAPPGKRAAAKKTVRGRSSRGRR